MIFCLSIYLSIFSFIFLSLCSDWRPKKNQQFSIQVSPSPHCFLASVALLIFPFPWSNWTVMKLRTYFSRIDFQPPNCIGCWLRYSNCVCLEFHYWNLPFLRAANLFPNFFAISWKNRTYFFPIRLWVFQVEEFLPLFRSCWFKLVVLSWLKHCCWLEMRRSASKQTLRELKLISCIFWHICHYTCRSFNFYYQQSEYPSLITQ